MTAPPPLTQLPPARAVWAVAWPMVALGWLQTLYLVADAYWVGHLGSVALTALAAGSFGWWMLVHVGELPATGVHSRVAHAEGAGTRDTAASWTVHGLVVAGLLWGVVVVTARWWVPAYVAAIGVQDAVTAAEARGWLHTMAWATAGVAAQAVVGAVFRGLGQTRTALVITGAALVGNALLDPLLIWGIGPLPAMGLRGAAVATGVSAASAGLVGAGVLAGRGVRLGRVPWRWADARRLVAIGGPLTLTGLGFSGVYVLLGRLIAGHGEHHLAALGVGHRLEGFTYLAAVGLGTGAATMVGQHLGAGDGARAREAAWSAARTTAVIMGVGSVLGLVLAAPLYRVFTDDPVIVASGVVYLRWQALVWLFMGLEVVFEGAFTGLGDTRPALIIGGTLTAARLPAAWLLADVLGAGVVGIWWAIAGSTACKGIVLGWWWWRRTRGDLLSEA